MSPCRSTLAASCANCTGGSVSGSCPVMEAATSTQRWRPPGATSLHCTASDMPTAIARQELDPERSGLDGSHVTGPQVTSAPQIVDVEHRPVYDHLGDEPRIRHHLCNGEQRCQPGVVTRRVCAVTAKVR